MGLYWKHYEACFPQSMWMHQKCLLGSLWKCHSNFRSKIDWCYRRVAYHRCTNFGSQKWFCEKRNMVCFLISLPSAKIGWEKEVIGHFRLPLYFENQFSIFDAQILVIVPFYRLSIESHDQLGFNWRRKNNGKSSFSWKQTKRALFAPFNKKVYWMHYVMWCCFCLRPVSVAQERGQRSCTVRPNTMRVLLHLGYTFRLD